MRYILGSLGVLLGGVAIYTFFFMGAGMEGGDLTQENTTPQLTVQNNGDSAISSEGTYDTVLQVGETTLFVEIADTPQKRSRGLSGRAFLPIASGMLFPFDHQLQPSFWMKDMQFSIDIIWIRGSMVIGVEKNLPLPGDEEALKTYSPNQPIDYALEVNAGWAEKNNITIGTSIFGGPFPSLPIQQEEKQSNTNEKQQSPPSRKATEARSIVFDVPFTPQAPFADWDDPRQQDGCEEASIIMAMRWVEGNSLTPEEALEEIFALSAYAEELFGTFRDTSTIDTARLLVEYYNYSNVEVYSDIDAEDIKEQLTLGNVVIVPAFGQALGNPYFTPPGPVTHMLLIRGYDETTKEFITNDPGTRRGEGYRYSYTTLVRAIRDYPTGFHEPVPTIERRMIAVGPKTL